MRSRLIPRSAGTVDALILGAIVLAATVVYSHYALRIGTFQDDEELYMRLARYIAGHFPSAIWAPGIYTRGLQRLDPVVLAAPFSFMRGPGAFEVDHVIQCLLFASTAIPVYLLARRAGLGRPLSHVAALLSIVVPWAVVSTSFLTESLAYPAFGWILYTSWRAVQEPTRKREVLALLALAVGVLSRTALLGTLPLMPVAALWQTLACETQGSIAARLRAVPGRLWRSHPIAGVLLVGGVAIYAADQLGLLPASLNSTLTGSYGVPSLSSLGSSFAKDRNYLSRMIAGTDYVPFGFALAWFAVTFVKREDRARHCLAVICLLGLVCELLSLLPAGPDERYVMYGAIPIVLGFVAALSDRIGITVVLGAIAAVLLIDSVTWPPVANVYDYFTYPAAVFYSRVLMNHLAELPLIHPPADRVIEGALVVVSLAWAALVRRRALLVPATAALCLATLALGVTQTGYALKKYSGGAGRGQTAAARSWVDRHVPGGAQVATLANSLGTTADYVPIWREVEFWNTSIDATAFVGYSDFAPLPLGIAPLSLQVQAGTGLLSTTEVGRPRPVPRYVLVPRVGTLTLGLDVEAVAEDPSLPLNLVRLREPARIGWALAGTSAEGFMAPAGKAQIELYQGARREGHECVSLALVGPPNYYGTWPFRIGEDGHVLQRGRLAALQRLDLTVPTHGANTLTITVSGSVLYPNGEKVSARVEDVAVGRCGATSPAAS